jgi:hypothetical protein
MEDVRGQKRPRRESTNEQTKRRALRQVELDPELSTSVRSTASRDPRLGGGRRTGSG